MRGLVVVVATGAMAATIFVVMWPWKKWAAKRFLDRFIADALTQTSDRGSKLKPESDYIVTASETDVVCSRPDGTKESVKWNDLQRVEILTTDEGPFVPDVFWVLFGSADGCVIPWGATGEKELVDRLQSLPGFRIDAAIRAASLTTNNRLLCWERTPQNALPVQWRAVESGGGAERDV